jgi:hypothetical protein
LTLIGAIPTGNEDHEVAGRDALALPSYVPKLPAAKNSVGPP